MPKSKMIDRRNTVAYLRYLANVPPPADIKARNPQWDDAALDLLSAGLRAAANQIENGVIEGTNFVDLD